MMTIGSPRPPSEVGISWLLTICGGLQVLVLDDTDTRIWVAFVVFLVIMAGLSWLDPAVLREPKNPFYPWYLRSVGGRFLVRWVRADQPRPTQIP